MCVPALVGELDWLQLRTSSNEDVYLNFCLGWGVEREANSHPGLAFLERLLAINFLV